LGEDRPSSSKRKKIPDEDLHHLYEQSKYTGSARYEYGYMRAVVMMMQYHVNVAGQDEGARVAADALMVIW
jgi:hypothetical protein